MSRISAILLQTCRRCRHLCRGGVGSRPWRGVWTHDHLGLARRCLLRACCWWLLLVLLRVAGLYIRWIIVRRFIVVTFVGDYTQCDGERENDNYDCTPETVYHPPVDGLARRRHGKIRNNVRLWCI